MSRSTSRPARFASGVHVVDLADETREDAALGFGARSAVPARALTTGLGTLYRARELIVLVTGAAKAPALRAMLEEPVGPACPASLLRDHPRLTVICDRDGRAAAHPRPECDSDRVLVVLGHREPGISAEHRISKESRARLRHARALARESATARRRPHRLHVDGRAVGGGADEDRWDEHAAPALLEVAGRDTAENASRSLPIVLALGEARHVVVVSSAWHIRVPCFFAPYRRFGLASPTGSFAHGHWPRMLARAARRAAPGTARRAMASVRPPR